MLAGAVLARSAAHQPEQRVVQPERSLDSRSHAAGAKQVQAPSKCVRVADANFDKWYLSQKPSRKSTRADCKSACLDEGSAHHAWCVGFEFEGSEKGTCKLFGDCNSLKPQCLRSDECTQAATNDADSQGLRHPSTVPGESFEAIFGKHAYSWTTCSFDANKAAGSTALSYRSPVWPDGHEWQTYKWAKLPKQTHLLLFGTSSMQQVASALRAASAAHGTLMKTVTVSSNRDCKDPTIDPRTQQWPQSTSCQKACNKMTLGPSGNSCSKCRNSDDPSCGRCKHDPHSITVDYLSGDSTITTIANHGQSQRLNGRFGEYLSMVAPRNGAMNFTHGAFMNPHTDSWFDGRCDFLRKRNGEAKEGDAEKGMEEDSQELEQEYEETHLYETQRTKVGKVHLLCSPTAGAWCPRQHPHFATMAKWVDHEVAGVINPARDEHDFTPFASFASASTTGVASTNAMTGVFRLHCVTDHQLQGRQACPDGRNTTVWLGQSKIVYANSGAAGNLPSSHDGGGQPPCYCEHLCNARCARGGRCYAGPGLAAAWLVLRAAGLASSNT